MLSAQASCLEIRLSFLLFFFFCCYFFSWVLLSFSRRGEKKGKKGVEEGRRWDESGVRQDLRRAVWTGPNLGELMKNIDSCSHSQGLRSWKTNLKHNLGNQLRSPWEPGGKKKERGGKGPPFSPPTCLSFPFLHLTGTWVSHQNAAVCEEALSAGALFNFFFYGTGPYMLSKCLKSLIKEMPQLISL